MLQAEAFTDWTNGIFKRVLGNKIVSSTCLRGLSSTCQNKYCKTISEFDIMVLLRIKQEINTSNRRVLNN